MRKLILIIGISLCLVSCSSKNGSTPLDFMETVQSTDLSLETGGLESFNTSEQMIIKKRGKPQQSGTTKKGEVVLEYADYQYTLAKDKIVSYSVKPDQMTARQAKIGDHWERIAELYGQDFYTRKLDSLNIKGYIDKESQRVIEFLVEQNKVKTIIVLELSQFK